jgi:rhodanese-related sulfurtransferase
MVARLAPAAVKAMLADGGELAFLDVREEGVHSQGHPFYAAPMPLSHMELSLHRRVPRKDARIVLLDDDGGDLATRAAARLAGFGYTEVAIVDGGLAAWRDAGYVVFSGVHVPSKAFGEYVEHHYGTPHINAAALNNLMQLGRNLVVLDSRPLDEFQVMSIPTGIDCPGAELAYRVHDLAPDPSTLVVVNCAGRTRSIIGAQSLINAGIPNQVVALENGTMGWHLTGLNLAHGETRHADAPSPKGLKTAQRCAAGVAERFAVPTCTAAEVDRWRAEAGRTLYLLDVRTAEEYAAGHLPGSVHAPGGQLVQSTEMWCATLGARIVLVDQDGVRARMTASWLVQMGWEAYVLEDGLQGAALETGMPPALPPGIGAAAGNTVNVHDLKAMLDAGEAVVVDFAASNRYKRGHIPGAWWAVRARLPNSLPKLPQAGTLVFTSPDGIVATLAAPEASELSARNIAVLEGGTAAWRDAGFDLATGMEHAADTADDVWLKPYDHDDGPVEKHMRAYLTWEIDLINEIERDGDHRFRLFLDPDADEDDDDADEDD